MRLLSLAVAALPIVAAAAAYTAPPMMLKAAQQQGCNLPQGFQVRDFAGHANGTDDAPAPSFFTFAYADNSTSVETSCQLNATSTSTTPEGLTPRFACENRDVKFIWTPSNKQLTLVERACRSPQGTPLYEASGTIIISAPCKGGSCTANATEYHGVFSSLQPVRDPTSYKMAYEMMEIE
ncbi:hypothetical protein V2A60_001062 [Cordyceps javanica]|uniref:Uncharacterized protein n=1 Tax=Cordyceps javanica TaxID=43265 RepID=A0A545V2E8_9HYPO|nr:hypothetical protein IF1G_05724 [Cordyceps javanica]TQW06906.1 hypothetical protein IF2G_05290 [Cordyceps javanica]